MKSLPAKLELFETFEKKEKIPRALVRGIFIRSTCESPIMAIIFGCRFRAGFCLLLEIRTDCVSSRCETMRVTKLGLILLAHMKKPAGLLRAFWHLLVEENSY